jgi:uncharacterized membrane protein YbhN (UPF0104 family)
MKKSILTLIKTVLPLLLGVYLIWFFFSSMSDSSKEQFYSAIKEANYLWLFLSVLFGWIATVSRAIRWGYVIEPLGYKTPLWNRYHAVMIGYLINLTIPRAGEASRAAMLYRSDEVPFAKAFGTIVAERAVDLMMLAGIGLFTMYIGAGDFELIWSEMITKFSGAPKEEGGFPWKYVVLGILALGMAYLAYKYKKDEKFKTKIKEFITGLIGGLLSVFKSKNPEGYIFHSIAIWACYLIMFALPFYALDQTSDFPVKGMLIGFIAGSIGIIFTNGGIGTYPLLVGLVIAFYLKADYPAEAEGIGNALGLLIWTSQTLMMIIMGLVSLVMLPKNHNEKNDKTAEAISED